MAVIVDERYRTTHSIQSGSRPVIMWFTDGPPDAQDKATKAAPGSLAIVAVKGGEVGLYQKQNDGSWMIGAGGTHNHSTDYAPITWVDESGGYAGAALAGVEESEVKPAAKGKGKK